MIGQQVGLAMIIAAASDLARPMDWGVSGFAAEDGAWLLGHGSF